MVVMIARPPLASARSDSTSCSAVVLSSPLQAGTSRARQWTAGKPCPPSTSCVDLNSLGGRGFSTPCYCDRCVCALCDVRFIARWMQRLS